MKLFAPLYERVMSWSRHRHAPWYLSALSFTESSFFPIPPDVMLAPMAMSQPGKWVRLAMLTTVFSVLGGLFGYLIGAYGFDLIESFLANSRYQAGYDQAVLWFAEWGVLAIFIAGFSPIPYKVFTIAAGAVNMAVLPFILASIVGRGLRFFLVAGLMAWGGPSMENLLQKYVERLGWATVVLAVVAVIVLQQ